MATALKVPQLAPIPETFVDALRKGWRVVGEQSKLRGAYRCGTVTLEKGDCCVSVSYFADGDGYHFGSPKAV